MTNGAAEKRVQGELNMNTAVLPALAIPSNYPYEKQSNAVRNALFGPPRSASREGRRDSN
jgi:hypothetical protein